MQDLILFLEQHASASLAIIALLLLSIFIEYLRHRRGAEKLTPRQVTQMINHDQALVLDLRPAELFAEGHIIDSQSLPLAELAEKSKKLEKMKNRPLILVCAKGLDSPKAATQLKNQGFKVQILGGGLLSWSGADLPLIKGKSLAV